MAQIGSLAGELLYTPAAAKNKKEKGSEIKPKKFSPRKLKRQRDEKQKKKKINTRIPERNNGVWDVCVCVKITKEIIQEFTRIEGNQSITKKDCQKLNIDPLQGI